METLAETVRAQISSSGAKREEIADYVQPYVDRAEQLRQPPRRLRSSEVAAIKRRRAQRSDDPFLTPAYRRESAAGGGDLTEQTGEGAEAPPRAPTGPETAPGAGN